MALLEKNTSTHSDLFYIHYCFMYIKNKKGNKNKTYSLVCEIKQKTNIGFN